MTPATQQWPWPIEVGQVMAMATLELGVNGFEHGDDISIDGGDYGRGCRVFKLTSKDHPEYPKWCVSIEIQDRVCFGKDPEALSKAYRQKMLDFVRDVVHRPGWSNAMRMATCEEGHPIYWQHVYGATSGGYGGSVLAYLVYDAAIAERDKGKEQPVVKDSSWRGALEGVVRHHTTRLGQIDARIQACEINASQKVAALAESLSRRLDALEKQAGPVGDDGRREKALARLEMAIGVDAMRQLVLMDGGPALIQGWVAAGDQATESLAESIRAFMRSKGYEFLRFRTTPFSGSSDSDSKDALIRDLLDCFADRRIYPPHEHALSREKLCRRAEKLGVKC